MKYLIIGIIAFAAAVGFISCKQEIVYEPPVFPKQQQVDCRHITGQSTICIPRKQRRRHDCLTNGAVIKRFTCEKAAANNLRFLLFGKNEYFCEFLMLNR